MRRSLLPLLALVLAPLACGKEKPATEQDSGAAPAAAAAADALPPGEGRLAVDGGRIWYKVAGAKQGMPLVMLHGGPGLSSFYLKPLETLGDERPVVRYDQLGGGKSDKLADTSKFTIAHFVDELEALRAHLGYEKMHLLGHSWGTILGVEYYKAHPDRVASLTLAGAALDIPAWEKHARDLVKTLSDSAQRAIKTREAEKNFAAPDYQNAVMEFYGKYVWLKPVQADLDSTMKTINEGIYAYMQGPSEFTITGTLKTYDATPLLKDIKVPVLFTVGDRDEANPPTIRRFASMTPGAEVAVIPDAAHLTTWDNPGEMQRVVREFLRKADATAAKK